MDTSKNISKTSRNVTKNKTKKKNKRFVSFRNNLTTIREFESNRNSNNNTNQVHEYHGPAQLTEGPYYPQAREILARAATAKQGPVLSENIKVVGFHRVKNNNFNNEDDEIHAEVCDLKTQLCWLIPISFLVMSFYGMTGGQRRKHRSTRKNRH